MAEMKKKEEKGKILVHILVVVLGVTSWSIMNGLWVELPILVTHLPEGWTLPSWLTIISQCGNLGPLGFVFLSWLFPKTKLETGVSMAVVSLLTLCAVLYALLWTKTAVIAGEEYSIALLTLTLFQSIFAATSSMSYLAFMSHLKAKYISSIFIGQGLSGLLPALIAFGQGAGDIECTANTTLATELFNTSLHSGHKDIPLSNTSLVATVTEPVFSVATMFLLLAAMGMTSLGSLLLLVHHPYCRTEHVDVDEEENCQLMPAKHDQRNNPEQSSHSTATEPSAILNTKPNHDTQINALQLNGENLNDNPSPASQSRQDKSAVEMQDFSPEMSDREPEVNVPIDEVKGQSLPTSSRLESWYLLALLVWINLLQNSYVLAIQVYSSLPYGLQIYNGVTKAENIVDPLACVATMFVFARRTRVISGLTLLGTLFAAYIITVAAMSPNPFLVQETMGGVLVVTAWIMCTVFNVFAKVSIAAVMRSQGRTSLIWTAGSSQTGALIGAILAYVMINQLNLFKDGPWCR